MASRFYNLSTDNTLGGVSPSDAIVSSQKAIKDYVDGKIPDIDNSTITLNTSDELQSNAVVNQNSGIVKTWTGTLQEYENILNKDSSTTYIITDDEVGGETVYTKNQTDSKIDEKISKNNHEITTNCITEIPQDIKLEGSSGSVRIKAGSKIYIPDGFESDNVTLKFNEVILSDDRLALGTSSYPFLVFYNSGADGGYMENITGCFSGPTAPTTYPNMMWYDTANNLIKRTVDYGSTWTTSGYSLPLCAGKYDSGYKPTKVFNGFGYIGSTVFALPGVEGLIPDGRNADGSLKNVQFVNDSIKIRTIPNGNFQLLFDGTTINYAYSKDNIYNEKENIIDHVGNGVIIVNCAVENNKITSFTSKTAFHAVDYNDSEYIANCAMPSDTYDDLTVGAAGSSYVAPADGYFVVAITDSGYAELTTVTTSSTASFVGGWARAFIPVKKGTVMDLYYGNVGTWKIFRFIYANGAQ